MDMNGAHMDGTLEEVEAGSGLQPKKYHLDQTITETTVASFIAKMIEAEALVNFINSLVPGAAGKLNSIGPERAAMIAVFLMEIAAHPEFMPADVDPTQAPLKAVLYDQLKRMLDHIDAYRPKLAEALRLAGDDLSSDFSAYYTNTQACAKRKQPNAAQTISTLKPYMAKTAKKKAKTTPPAKS